jgi:AcrR family transcriptional regulator
MAKQKEQRVERFNASYTAQLAHKLETAPPKKKGERTRERLILAAAEVLERAGFHAMRVSDITKAAGSSDGAFYVYFKDKKDVSLTVLEDFLSSTHILVQSAKGLARSPFHVIKETNLGWIRAIRANAGLMRSVFQLSDEDPEFGRIIHDSNRGWYERVVGSVVRNHPEGSVDTTAALFAVWALGGMMDELMRRVAVYPDEGFVDFLDRNIGNDEELATALSVIWYRVLYPQEELPGELPKLASALGRLGVGAVPPTRRVKA